MSNIFDASVLSTGDPLERTNMSKEDLVNDIMPKLQQILVTAFPNNPLRQQIKVYPDRLNFAAPCCGDSAKDNTKKRGNIILTGPFQMTYKCHNCGAHMPLHIFFKRFGQNLSLEAIDYIATHKIEMTTASYDSSLNYLYDNDLIESLAVDREYFKKIYSLEECDISNAGHFYLVNRKQYDFKKFLYQPKYQLLFLLNLTPSGKIFGLQIAHLNKNYKGPKYKTYCLSKIYSLLLKNEKEVPPEIDSLSMLFNILTINYNSTVTIVEGPMDSFLLKNCIATCGAGKHFSLDCRYRFLFDDDVTGRKHAIEKLNEGYEVFMWNKLKQDLNLPKREKWDVNDVYLYCLSNRIQIPNFDKYFSNDELDLLDI